MDAIPLPVVWTMRWMIGGGGGGDSDGGAISGAFPSLPPSNPAGTG